MLNNKEKLKVIWEFDPSPDAQELLLQAFKMLFDEQPKGNFKGEPLKKQGTLFSKEQLQDSCGKNRISHK